MFLLQLLTLSGAAYLISHYVFKKPKLWAPLFGVFLALTMISSWYISKYGTMEIGSFFERKEYTTQYYVNLFPLEKSSKNYRVKADIWATFNEYEESTNDGDSYTTRERAYYLQRAYFPNGGSVSFEDALNNGIELELGKKIEMEDDQGEDWWVELTKEKVNNR